MPALFQVVTTQGFKRDFLKISRRHPDVSARIDKLLGILEEDPCNTSARYDVKKLVGVKPGEGRWRIRSGDYRLRYDVSGHDVVLYSFRHRKEAY